MVVVGSPKAVKLLSREDVASAEAAANSAASSSASSAAKETAKASDGSVPPEGMKEHPTVVLLEAAKQTLQTELAALDASLPI
jgi:hypothetical protein